MSLPLNYWLVSIYLCKNEVIRCGSIIKLAHKSTNSRLHSHQIPYGTGSGQQSVTGFPDNGDPNSYWTIKGSEGELCPPGQNLKDGAIIKLYHINTNKYLHSHLHKSPLSGQQEVSAYSKKDGGGDEGDNWKLIILNGNEWKQGQEIRLLHVETQKYLHSHNFKYNHPIPGQHEITGFYYKNDDNIWIVKEGIFYPEINKN